ACYYHVMIVYCIFLFYIFFFLFYFFFCFFFFFQAEDGIRDRTVTGVQTCALPILPAMMPSRASSSRQVHRHAAGCGAALLPGTRSEERRVGKECRSRWSADH